MEVKFFFFLYNRKLQGYKSNVFCVYEQINAFLLKLKLQLYIDLINDNNFSLLPTLSEFIAQYDFKLEKGNKVVLMRIKKHLTALIKSFKEYFPSDSYVKKSNGCAILLI